VVGDYGGNNIAATWTQTGGLHSIGRLDGTTNCCSSLDDVNTSGDAVGWSHTASGVSVLGWSEATSTRVDLGSFGGTYGHGINDGGDVVATTYSGGAIPYFKSSTGSLVRLTVPATLSQGDPTDINNAGMIVGFGVVAGAFWHAIAWADHDAAAVDLGTLGGNQSWAQAANDNGDIVGWSEVTPGNTTRHAVLWPGGGSAVDLTTWPDGCAGSSEAIAVNNAGIIVGRCDDRPVLWTASEGMRYLPLPNGITSGEPRAINGEGEIVGIYNGFGAALWTIVDGPPIQAGDLHTCVLRDDRTILCWGYNDYGETNPPAGLGPVSYMSVGGYHTCAIKADRTVVCWGGNGYLESTVPAGVGSAKALGAGTYHSCAVRVDGTVACWGRNSAGQANVPAGLSGVVQVDGGEGHTCALKRDGVVVCWGGNGNGQLDVPPGLRAVQIAAGGLHNCALKTDGSVACWGYNGGGQAEVPAGLNSVAQVSSGGHNCAVKTDRSLDCWSYNSNGQLDAPSWLAEVAHVAAGGYHTCAIRVDDTVVCWGDGSLGKTNVPPVLRPPQQPQVISFSSTPPTPAVMGGTYTLSATGGGSNNPVVFRSLTTSVCSVSGDVVTFVAAGICTVAADQAGDASYLPAVQQAQSFEVLHPDATPIGGDVVVHPLDETTGAPAPVAVTFSSVTGAGTTQVTSSGTGAPLPQGFKLGNPPVYYDLTTTATYTGSITVCFTYEPGAFHNINNLTLFHRETSGSWTEITTTHDQPSHVICGTTMSLSPFILAELHYDFTGFYQPVDNGSVLNSVKAGSSIPVKFKLGGNQGLDVLTVNSPTTGSISCSSVPAIDPIEELASSSSGLHYDAAADQYVYVWKTQSGWKGTCRKFVLNLKDGTQHVALFQFK
jgi:probable HAF family extracellular repeat protein